MISIIDKQTSVAPLPVTFNKSVVSITTLFPANISNDDPAGIGALVTNSTSWFASSLPPALLPVLDDSVTVTVVWLVVVLPKTKPNITVVVELATVYITSSDVTYYDIVFSNVQKYNKSTNDK